MNLIAIVVIAGLVTALLIKSHRAAPALVSGVVTVVLLFAAFPTLGPAVTSSAGGTADFAHQLGAATDPPPTSRRITDASNSRILRLRLDEAATALGSANHATFGATIAVTEAYDLVGTLDQLVHRLPQLLGYSPAPSGRDPSATSTEAASALNAAAGGIDLAALRLTTAHNALGHLGHLGSEDWRMDALLFTAEETAELLKVGRCKVFDLLRNGDLRSIKIGGSRRIPRSALEEYVARRLAEDAA